MFSFIRENCPQENLKQKLKKKLSYFHYIFPQYSPVLHFRTSTAIHAIQLHLFHFLSIEYILFYKADQWLYFFF